MIRPPGPDDAPSIAALIVQLGYEATAHSIQKRLTAIQLHGDYATFLGAVSNHIVALALVHTAFSLEHDTPHARLLGFVVDSSWRKKGIGRALMDHVENWAMRQGAPFLTLSSGLHRADSHAFYERLGYENTGLRFGKHLS